MSDGMDPPPEQRQAPVVERLVRVDAIEGEDAWVLADRAGGCGGCAARRGCGHAGLMGEMPPVRIRVANRLGARPGDWVVLGMSSGALVGSLALAYGLPLLGFLLGAVAGAAFGAGAAIAAAVGGLALALALGRFAFASRRIDPARPAMLRPAAAPPRDGCPKA